MHLYCKVAIKSKTRNRKKSLLYIPGIISLAFILPLSLMALSERQTLKLHMIEVIWGSDEWMKTNKLPEAIKRNYIEITLTGNTTRDKVKLDFASLSVDEMISNLDTLKGISIVLSDSAKYESLIRILEICDHYPYLMYIVTTEKIWIFNRFATENQKQYLGVCGTMSSFNFKADPPTPAFTTKTFPVFAMLLILGIVSTFRIFRSSDGLWL